MTAHESFTHSPEYIQSSNTNFGYTFAGVFGFLAVLPMLTKGLPPKPLLLALAAVFMLITLHRPGWLAPLNKLWFKFSVVLGKIMVPLTMIPIWLITILPIGLVFKLVGSDPLRLRFDASAKSYWLPRTAASRTAMTDQF